MCKSLVNELHAAIDKVSIKFCLVIKRQACSLNLPVISVGGILQTFTGKCVAEDILEFVAKQYYKFSPQMVLSASLLTVSHFGLQKCCAIFGS